MRGMLAHSVSPAAVTNGPSFTSPLADLDKKVEEIYDIPVGKCWSFPVTTPLCVSPALVIISQPLVLV